MSQETTIQPRRPKEAGTKVRRPQKLRIQPKRPQYPYLRTLELDRGACRRTPRKIEALRKFWSEGCMAKENGSKGALLRKRIFEHSLNPKGYRQ